MATNKKQRLWLGNPEVKEYLISSAEPMTGALEWVTKLKYIKSVPNGQKRLWNDGKEYSVFEDRVFEVWVDNPTEESLVGLKLRFTTEITD